MRFALNKKGFTLIEMMIVVSIIGIFSSMTIINFRGNEKIRDIDSESRLVLDGIRRMQTSSLSGRIIDTQVPVAYIFEIIDCSNNCSYSLKARKADGGIINIETVALANSKVNVIGGNSLSIEIAPPRSDIKIFINSITATVVDTQIKLTHTTDSSIAKNIRINSISGRIDILKLNN